VFWAALAFIIVGSGFLKANISVMVGQLYKLTDIRRDGAYTIFYMGINRGRGGRHDPGRLSGRDDRLGLGLRPCRHRHAGRSRRLRAGQGRAERARAKRRCRCPKTREWSFYGIGLAAVAVIWALIQYQDVIQACCVVSGVALLGYVLYESFKLPKEPRERMFAILFLISLNPLFWGLFEQAGGSMNLFTDRFVDRGGVPASMFQSINPIYIILLRAAVRRAVAVARPQAGGNLRPRPSSASRCADGLANLVLVWGAKPSGWRR
jgi:POT family proton-dependent oligopeptide transporter